MSDKNRLQRAEELIKRIFDMDDDIYEGLLEYGEGTLGSYKWEELSDEIQSFLAEGKDD